MSYIELPNQYIGYRSQFKQDRVIEIANLEKEYHSTFAPVAFDTQIPKAAFISFYVTGRCHLKCIHCHAEENFSGLPQDASTELILQILNGLCAISNRIQFTGGEIFVRTDPESRKNDLLFLIDETTRRGCEATIQTTGMHLTTKMLDYISQRNVNWFSVSLDGPDAEYNSIIRGTHRAFTKTVEIIKELKKYGFRVKVGTCITRLNNNLDKLMQLGELLVSLNVDNWKLYQFYGRELGRASGSNTELLSISTEEFYLFINALDSEFSKSIGVTSKSVDQFSNASAILAQPNGIITVLQGTKDIIVGNILHEKPLDILQKLNASGFLNTVAQNNNKTYY